MSSGDEKSHDSGRRQITGRSTSAPTPLNEAITAQMKRMPRSDTKPELALRRALHAAGLRFTVNRRDLPGTPDVVFSRVRLAVFVDGCFWHACPQHGVLPKNNREWWRAKLAANRRRDREKDAALEALGWEALHLWEHEAVAEMAALVVGRYRIRRELVEGERKAGARRSSAHPPRPSRAKRRNRPQNA